MNKYEITTASLRHIIANMIAVLEEDELFEKLAIFNVDVNNKKNLDIVLEFVLWTLNDPTYGIYQYGNEFVKQRITDISSIYRMEKENKDENDIRNSLKKIADKTMDRKSHKKEIDRYILKGMFGSKIAYCASGQAFTYILGIQLKDDYDNIINVIQAPAYIMSAAVTIAITDYNNTDKKYIPQVAPASNVKGIISATERLLQLIEEYK
jgi:hypothetical protein